MKISRANNFDLIRLLAAVQVAIIHIKSHLNIQQELLQQLSYWFISLFPGVPIFFFISGFLVYASFERNQRNIRQFYRNRLLRIYPALWACFVVTVVLLLVDYQGSLSALMTSRGFLVWIVAQLSLFQFYTPDILRFWGVGTPNGSLWTITVELQFYLSIPLIAYLWNRDRGGNWWILLLLLLSIIANLYFGRLKALDMMIGKLGAVTVLPYLYYFMIGIAAWQFWQYVRPFVENKFYYWLLGYLGFSYFFRHFLGFDTTDYWISTPFNLIADLLLAGLVFSCAFSYRTLSSRLLKGTDISYGLYIYHMLVVNFMVERAWQGELLYFFLALLLSISAGYLSWKLVEQPALRLKHRGRLPTRW